MIRDNKQKFIHPSTWNQLLIRVSLISSITRGYIEKQEKKRERENDAQFDYK
jgi:hypothetical protein